MKKTPVILLVSLLLYTPCFAGIWSDDRSDDAEKASSAAADAASASASAVTVSASDEASNPGRSDYNAAVGLEASLPGRAIPGVSYTQFFRKNIFATGFLGAVCDGRIFAGIIQANGYYMLNDYFYAGLGFSAALDDDHSVIVGIGNPSLGVVSALYEDFKMFFETDLLLMRFSTNHDGSSGSMSTGLLAVLRAGIRYYY